jgi:hypothetical protein
LRNADGKVTIWSGIEEQDTSTGPQQGDTIDAGAGDDHVIASWANVIRTLCTAV